MRVKETTRKEMEERLSGMSDFVKMDYLSSCLKNQTDFDTRRFLLLELGKLFESKGMFLDAARSIRTAAEINTNRQNKINDFLKAVNLFVRSGDYEQVDITSNKIFELTEQKQTKETEARIKEFYNSQGIFLIEKNRRKQAAGLYEKMLTLKLDEKEKSEIQKKLLGLYEGIGEVNRYITLKRKFSG